MKVGERGGAALVIFDQSSKPRGPSEGTLHHPSSGQENEAALGLGQFDDAEFDAVLSGGGPGGFPGIALIDEGDFDVRLGRGLNGLGDAADLGAVVGVGGRDMQGQPMPERVDGQMQLRSLLALGPVVAGPCSAFRVERSVRLSMTAAVGCSPRPAASRNTARKSSARASKHPARSQRCACW